MLKKLTKHKALKICKELWTWMLNTPEATSHRWKLRWPGWEALGVDDLVGCIKLSIHHRAYCPCCQYAEEHNTHIPYSCIGICPLKTLWPDGCISSGSPYDNLEDDSTREAVVICAQAIIAECNKLLAPRKRG